VTVIATAAAGARSGCNGALPEVMTIKAREVFRKIRKPPDSGGFSDSWRRRRRLEKPHRLLDIARSLC
jgi:hypothetical protein